VLVDVDGLPLAPRAVGPADLALDVELLVVRVRDGRVLERVEPVLLHLLVVERAGDDDPAEPLGGLLVRAFRAGPLGLVLLLLGLGPRLAGERPFQLLLLALVFGLGLL